MVRESKENKREKEFIVIKRGRRTNMESIFNFSKESSRNRRSKRRSKAKSSSPLSMAARADRVVSERVRYQNCQKKDSLNRRKGGRNRSRFAA
ncbi:hypothetical protein, partial [Algimonas porphyrae]|uniref:hypothetical protein n=1 Tax=Algimonas porphyrae TaxID=1128113 RepID=UPI0024E08183